MFNLLAEIKTVEKNEDSGELKISGWASTPSTDRARDVVQTAAWTKGGLNNYNKNPILLFNHNYDEPIGKATLVDVRDGGLYIEATIFPVSKAYTLVKNGVLKTFSVGFLIKDAEYLEGTGGLLITEAELLEVSVVSVPCNQDATFELSKSAEKPADYEKILEKFGKKLDKDAEASNDIKMTQEEIEKMLADASAKAVKDALAADKAAREEEAKLKAAAETEAAANAEAVRTIVGETVAEKVSAAVTEAMEKNNGEDFAKTVAELSETIKAQGDEIKAFQDSRREGFFPGTGSDQKMWENNETRQKIMEGYILSKALRKPLDQIESQKSLVQKVNASSSVQVSSDDFEQRVSTELMRDIELALVVAPLFRSINLTSASQIIPIAPDTGYATHQASGTDLPGTKPNGLLNEVGGGQPYALNEVVLRTDKLVSKAYLANDTEEDTILPILPIIRDGMIRQHAKSMDQMILTAGVAGSTFPNMVSKGLLNYAATGSRTVEGPAAAGKYAAAHIRAARRNMDKYGINPEDVISLVSTTAYYDLIDDPEFHDVDQISSMATKLTGEVGRMFGVRILVSSEMNATAAENNVGLLTVNTRNFIVPRLRGMTTESEYSVEGQHWVLASTQRLGFSELIAGAKSVTAIDYGA